MIAIRNAAGRYTRADLETVTAAAESAESSFRADTPASSFRADNPPPTITNAAGDNAYPIATFSWLILPLKPNDPEKRRLLLEFLDWILDSGERQAAGLGYVAIPDKILRAERLMLAQLREAN
jgi:phosphate transport system substrate-binding protein